MKNTWKGLVVGGLTGVGAGLMLDGLSRAGERAGSAGRKARERAPEFAEKLRERAPDIAERLSETAEKVSEKVRERAPEIAGKLKDVDVREAAHRLGERARP